MKKYKRLTKMQKLAHLNSQRQSGLSVIKYCTQHNITKQTFYGWRSRYEATLSLKESTQEFVALNIEPTIDESNSVIAEIQHPNGCIISFYKGCTALFLAETIKQF